MHTLLGFLSLLLTLFGGLFLLALLRRVNNWSHRRTFQLLILGMPLITLGLGIDGLYHLISHLCLLRVPLWDLLFGIVVPFGMEGIAFGALVLGVIRLVLLARTMKQRCLPAPEELQMQVVHLAKRLQTPSPQIALCAFPRPLALSYGLFHPTILLSPWMLEHLDAHELEAVLAHELEHVARHDTLVIWLATMLRDAFFYFPTSRVAYHALQREKELMCDDLAVSMTQRPLDLASALAKVWLNTLEGPHLIPGSIAQSLVGAGEAINGRIERLMTTKERVLRHHPQVLARQIKMLTFFVLLIVQGTNLIILFELMRCIP